MTRDEITARLEAQLVELTGDSDAQLAWGARCRARCLDALSFAIVDAGPNTERAADLWRAAERVAKTTEAGAFVRLAANVPSLHALFCGSATTRDARLRAAGMPEKDQP